MNAEIQNLFASLMSPAARLLGTTLLAFNPDEGAASFSFNVSPEYANGLGTVQGGFLAAMLDETAGLTARLLSGGASAFPTLDFRVSFFRPAKSRGKLIGRGKQVLAGRRIIFLEAELIDPDDAILARLSATSLVTAFDAAAKSLSNASEHFQ